MTLSLLHGIARHAERASDDCGQVQQYFYNESVGGDYWRPAWPSHHAPYGPIGDIAVPTMGLRHASKRHCLHIWVFVYGFGRNTDPNQHRSRLSNAEPGPGVTSCGLCFLGVGLFRGRRDYPGEHSGQYAGSPRSSATDGTGRASYSQSSATVASGLHRRR